MKRNKPLACLLATLFLAVPEIGLSQNVNQNRTIIINGQSTQVSVIQVNGRSYVDLEALASAVNGSLSSAGSQIAFSLPPSHTAPAATAATTAKLPSSAALASNPGFSKGFLNAGIETAATLREWHAALASAIQSGYSITNGMLAPYRAPATTNLRLTSIAVSTDSDRSAYQLLSNEFQNMVKLSDKYAAARANMNYIAPDALQNDSLNQRFVACGHSLGGNGREWPVCRRWFLRLKPPEATTIETGTVANDEDGEGAKCRTKRKCAGIDQRYHAAVRWPLNFGEQTVWPKRP